MKCTSKLKSLLNVFTAGLLSLTLMTGLSGCGKLDYDIKYGSMDTLSTIGGSEYGGSKTSTFASKLCVVESDIVGDGSISLAECESAVLFDVENKGVIYSKNPLEQLYPASLTKIMTALVAIKYGQMDQVLTATNAVNIKESGAQLAGIVAGDKMTLHQALRILLLYSANDVALLIAENICDSVDSFVALMNEEAVKLGATGTHFVNPHGLTDPNHYTTAYDLYLIFNECIKYDEFTEIISMPGFDTTYTNINGKTINISVKNTNGYANGKYTPPSNVSVVGGKTGTTSAAGHCLILLSRNINGSPFISVVLKSESTESLYNNMNSLLMSVE